MNWMRERRVIIGLTIVAYTQWGFITALLYWSLRTGTASWFQAVGWGFDGWAAENVLRSGGATLDSLRKLEDVERKFRDEINKKDKGQ